MRLRIWGNGSGRRWNGRCLRKADAEDSHDSLSTFWLAELRWTALPFEDSPAGSGQAKMAVPLDLKLLQWKAGEADSCGVDFVTDIQPDQHGGY
jgi:hypothetical protein